VDDQNGTSVTHGHAVNFTHIQARDVRHAVCHVHKERGSNWGNAGDDALHLGEALVSVSGGVWQRAATMN